MTDSCYELFGQVVSTQLDLSEFLDHSHREPTLHIKHESIAVPAEQLTQIYPSSEHDIDLSLRLYSADDYYRLVIDNLAIFDIFPTKIVVDSVDGVDQGILITKLLGPVMATWLELKGIPVIHASAIAINDDVIMFMGHSGVGKTTLLSAMLYCGHNFFSDDLVPLNVSENIITAYPGWPFMRMREDQIMKLDLSVNDFPVAPGRKHKRTIKLNKAGLTTFNSKSCRLRAIYYLQKDDSLAGADEVSIKSLDPNEALFALIQCSYAAAMLNRLGQHKDRIKKIAKIVENTKLKQANVSANLTDYKLLSSIIHADLEL